ncbi:ribonuclease H-like domain-containing protein [Lentinula guzmanii]|uniref:Ribonuclease H-like domain-containing protein n=1 Tax=Lentinula guzmanii TaxID=2804957 RepID=A0AA38JXQ6_9AGAR|nr:ribonuclease H-like domain-containing protein [Lentinula guzmanii]
MSGYRGRGGSYGQDARGGNFGGRGGGGGFGRRGGPPMINRDQSVSVTVQTNCFTIKKLPQKDYYLYDMFKPDVGNFGRRQEIFDKLQSNVAPHIFSPRALYDGKALVYSSHRLELPSGDGSSFLIGWSDKLVEGNRGTFRVTLKLTAGEIIRPKNLDVLGKQKAAVNNPEVTTAVNLLNILIRQDSNQKNPHNARAFFSSTGKMSLPGIELWRGFHQSVRLTREHALINIDTTMTTLYKPGLLLDLCMDYMQFRDTRNLMFDERGGPHFYKLERFLKKLQITVQTTKKRRTIYGLVPTAGKYVFSKDGTDLTIEEYLKTNYNIHVRHPNLVGVRLTKPGAEHQVILPLEVCNVVPGQFYRQRLPDHLTPEVVRFATLNPTERLNAITGGASQTIADSPILNYKNSEVITQSGMEIDTDPITIRGQLLALPKVKFRSDDLIPTNGSWNVVNRTLYRAAPLKCWAVVNFVERGGDQLAQTAAQGTMHCAKALGFDVSGPCTVQSGSGQAVEQLLNRTIVEMKGKFPNLETIKPRPLLIVILPQNAAEVRQRVKHWGDFTAGVLTQCIREGKLKRANDQYFNNIALKLNARLKGSNFVVSSPAMTALSNQGCFIIMGADVAHPGPGLRRPSTASLVWSMDPYAAHYHALTEVQHPRLEIIQDLKQMVYEAVLGFGKQNGTPKQIIFFRDGVSEGEFRKVAEGEITDIGVAIDNLWRTMNIKDPKPRLTFIVVGKRHHIAFFPTRDSLANDGKGNCVAGFASDQNYLSHPSTTDFYLQSHAAIQGTSRSGHYTVIHDEIFDSNINKIQELAFSLCHVYAKATRSVSIPAPVYYADLACARSSFHYAPNSAFNLASDAASSVSNGQDFNLDDWKANFKRVNRDMATSMYFL